MPAALKHGDVGDAKTRRVRLEGRGSFRAMRQVSSASWSETTIADALVKVRRPKSIPLSQYLSEGCYPVIDQGKNLVAGYTNDESAVIFSPLPITIFGDHTRIVKFSKIPFATGADGTQLLYPKAGIDPTFFYYAIKNIDLSNYFYARHFKYLKASSIQLPLFPVQRQIADILSAYDDLIENNRRRVAILEETARLAYRKWFGGEVGRTTTLGEVCQSFGGGTPKTNVSEYWNGDVPWGVPTDVTRNSCLALLDTERKITALGLEKSSAKMLPANAILMTSRASVGYFAIADFPVCTNQGFISIVPNDAAWRWYLLFNLMSRVEEIRGNAKGSTFPEISRARFRSMDISVPDKESLESLNDIVTPLMQQVRILSKQSAALAAARDMLLPRLMKGEVA